MSLASMDSEIIDLVWTTFFFYVFAVFPIVTPLLSFLFVIYSPYRWIMLLYFAWIWKDRNTAERGGRIIEWVRNWRVWRCIRNYFQIQFIKEEGCQLDPKRNYLLCGFPHGILPYGMISLLLNTEKTEGFFPFHERYLCTLNVQFYIPFNRELCLSCGFISASEKSLKYLLGAPDGGHVLCLLVGGAYEIYYCRPNIYKFVIKKRRGFIRIALETGAPLLPTISFNETSIFDQFSLSKLSTIQEYLRKLFFYPPVLPKGRWLVCPRQVPVTVLVGKPIEVKRNPSPSKEEIDVLHQLFIKKLIELFENNKHKYIENASNTFIEIV